MEPSTEERPPLGALDGSDRFECPSSNERNTNTLCSGSESDVMKTPSAGGDSPSVFSPELLPAGGEVPPRSAGGEPPQAPKQPPASQVPPLVAPSSVNGAAVASPAMPSPPLPSSLAASPSLPSPPTTVAARRSSAAVTAATEPDAIADSPHRAAECDCLLCDATFHPRLGEGLRQRDGRGVRTTYHSQISPEANSIKLKIRVETLGPEEVGARRRRKQDADGRASPPVKAKRRRRSRKASVSDDDEEDDEVPVPVRRRRSKSAALAAAAEEAARPQGPWADQMPVELLQLIFSHVVAEGDGAVPALVRLSRVCRQWRAAALAPHLWHTVDLATGRIPDRRRHERLLLWLIQNRLSETEQLSLAGWSAAVTPAAVEALCVGCPQLRRLSLAGCRDLTPDELLRIASSCGRLQALDLSAVQPHSSSARSPVGPHCLQEVARLLGARLTSLTLSHNTVGGIQQILNGIGEHCPNLEVLDLSNMMNAVRDIVPVRIERLQAGCKKLRILRWTNTELKLADVTLKEQMASEGFPELEELSVAVPKERHWGLDDAGVERLLKTSESLRLLDVRGCSRLSDSSLVRVPAWNLQHLFLSGCEVTRAMADRLELIVRKWRHSLLELDLSWASNQPALDAALQAMAEPDTEQPPPPLRKLDLCGAAGTFPPVCALVAACPELAELNLTSCRALPRGVKRLYRGAELARLRTDIAAGKYAQSPEERT